MERNPSFSWRELRPAMLLLAGLLVVANTGCVGLLANVLYRGRLAPAACDRLEGKRVAVVCTSNSSDFGPSPNADLIAKGVGILLAENVEEIEVVAHQKVAAWLDEHDVDFIDHTEIGRALNVDYVVAIDIELLRLQDNQTLYKGNASYRLEVIDITDDGRAVYAPFTPPVIHPKISGVPTTSVTKEHFRRQFVEVIAGDIARHFYEHDLNELVARDRADLDTR